jgi:hypothetical protein
MVTQNQRSFLGLPASVPPFNHSIAEVCCLKTPPPVIRCLHLLAEAPQCAPNPFSFPEWGEMPLDVLQKAPRLDGPT